MDKMFLTVKDAAAILQCSDDNIYRLLHSGKIPAIKVGGSYRIPRDAFINHLLECRVIV